MQAMMDNFKTLVFGSIKPDADTKSSTDSKRSNYQKK